MTTPRATPEMSERRRKASRRARFVRIDLDDGRENGQRVAQRHTRVGETTGVDDYAGDVAALRPGVHAVDQLALVLL